MSQLVKFSDVTWQVPDGVEPDEQGAVLRRARLVEGTAGFHAHVVDCPPHTVLPPHSHDHGELFVVIGGSCTVGTTTLEAFDTVAIPANEVYGVTAGADGLRFMIVRGGAAKLAVQ